jgi:hypothetical protein
MKYLVLLLLFPLYLTAQTSRSTRTFPQQEINRALQQAWQSSKTPQTLPAVNNTSSVSPTGVYQLLKTYKNGRVVEPKIPSYSLSRSSSDTLFVGVTGNDTVKVTGNWQNNGPIYVVNSGVLIFNNADATILGNIYVVESGQLIATNSTLYIPQQYFYQRSVLTAQSGSVILKDCTMNFGGLNHNFSLMDSSSITVQNVHFTDWTTTGINGKPTFSIDTCNVIGEIIASDSGSVIVNNTDTVLIWHHIPKNTGLTWTFPNGINLANYSLTPTSPGVNGLKYTVEEDNCKLAWWALMPEDGSNVEISNSKLRAIGAWFTRNDSTTVTGLVDNSSYISSGNLFNDRTLILDTTSVTTWNLYPMDSAITTITSCIAGEIGSSENSQTTCSSIFVDGTGGYFWTTDTALQIAGFCAFTCNVRSEGDGFELAAYSSISNGAASGIDNSILFLVQTSVLQQPIAYDGSDVWVAQISSPATSYVNDSVPIPGSAYILRGPQSQWMSFDHYKLYYQIAGSSTWTAITDSITSPVNQSNLATWNTTGLAPGNYTLILSLFDNDGDSVSAQAAITLLPSVLEGIQPINNNESVSVYPNPTSNQLSIICNQLSIKEISIDNVLGQRVCEKIVNNSSGTTNEELDVSELPSGIYFYQLAITNSQVITGKFVKE